MSDWSPPDSDFDTNMGEGIALGGGRVSPGTQAARDRAAAVLRTTFEDNSGLGNSVDVQVAKVAGRKTFTPPAQDFAFTPPQADFQSPAEKSETGPSLMDQLLAPWKGETAGSLVKQNAFVRLADYGTKVLDLQKQIAAEHPDMGPLEVASLSRQQYKDQYGHAPELDINWSELPHQIYQQITDQPAAFVSNLFKSLVVDPEMLLLGTTGLPAKLAQTSKVAAATMRAGEVGAQMGAQSAGISAVEQLQKTGEVSAQPTAQAAAQGAGMGLALGALHSAVSVGLRAVGKEKGAPITPEVEQEFAKRFDADVQDGMPASQAMAKNMRDAGMEPKEADAMGAAVSRADRAMDEVLRSMEPEQAETKRGQFGNMEQVRAELTTEKGTPFVMERRAPGQYNLLTPDGERIGDASYTRMPDGGWKMTGVQVDPRFQRQGIASATYDFLEQQIGKPFEYRGTTSAQGEAFWRDRLQEPAERRTDTAERARVDQMSPAEMRKALFTDDLTGLPNRRAYAEADKQPITASIDVDGLKWINDNLGHEAGDQLIRHVADALKDHDAYHLSGDEFVAQFPDIESARAAMQVFQDTLAKSKFEFETPKGERIIIDGPGATHGIGDTVSASDAALRERKVSKELSGERAARGEAPPRLQRVAPEALSDAGERAPAGDQVQAADPRLARGQIAPGQLVKATSLDSAVAQFHAADAAAERGFLLSGGRDADGQPAGWPQVRDAIMGDNGRAFNEKNPREWLNRAEKLNAAAGELQANADQMAGKRTERALAADDLQEQAPRLGVDRRASGKADPRLLGLLALTGAGAASAYYLTQDSGNKVRNALIAGGLGAAALALGKTMGVAGRLFDGLKDTRYRITDMTDQYGAGVRLGELGSMRLEHALNAILPDVAKRTEVLHAYQSGDVSALSPVQLKYLDTLKRGFEKGGEMGQAAGVLPEQLLKDYITQLWVRGLNTKDSLIENLKNAFTASAQTSPGMSPKTRFAKQRSIPDYKSGIEAGLVPVTLDPSAILRIYLNNVNKAVQNKKFISAMGNGADTLGRPLTIKGDVLENMIRQRAMAEMDGLPIDGAGKKMVADIAAIKSPNDYTLINHPQLANTRVLSDIAPSVKALFDANDANAATRAAHAVSIAAKRGLFSFSLFHAKSLLDAMLGTPLAGWRHVPGALKMLREGGNAGLDDLVKAGLNVVAKPLEADASAFSNGMRVLEAKMPMAAWPIKGVRWAQEHMDHFLWNVVHPSFKVSAALAQYEKQLLKNPQMPREQIAKNVASYANDIFGGLDWFKIADGVQNKYGRDLALAITSPSGRRFMQIAMLAPDWTVATTRAMAKAIPGVSDPMIGAMHRGYVLRSALVYLTMAEGLNQLFSGHHLWENQDPTMVDLGDGRRMQLSKHFMEPVHWLIKPAQQAMNKLGYLPKEFMTQALGVDYLSTKGAPPMDTSVVGRVKHAFKGAMPIPSSVAAESGPGPALSGLVGLPIYGKTEQQAIDAAVEKALGVYKQKQEDGTKQRYRSEGQAEAAATKRVQKQYQKRRAEQEKRESQ